MLAQENNYSAVIGTDDDQKIIKNNRYVIYKLKLHHILTAKSGFRPTIKNF